MVDMTQSTSPLEMSERLDVWTRSPIKFWNSGFMASTFLKSLSLRTPPLETQGASTSMATPSAIDRLHSRYQPAGRPSPAQTAVVAGPATLAIHFHAAVAPIGSTPRKFSLKHSSPRGGLLGVRTPANVIFGRRLRAPRQRHTRPFGCSTVAFVYYLRSEEPGCALSTRSAAARN